MHNRRSLALVCATLLCAALLPPAAFAITYNCSPVTIPGGGTATARGINNSGIMAGYYTVTGPFHGFIQSADAGNFQTVDYPGADFTQLFSINNNGVTVGKWQNSQNQTSGFFTRDASGNFSPISLPPSWTLGSAYGINDNGAISIIATNSPSGQIPQFTYAVLNPDGTITPYPGYHNGEADFALSGMINNSLQMVELYSAGYGGTQIATAAAIIATIGDGIHNYAYGINNSGLVIGYSGVQSEPPWIHFLYDLNANSYATVMCPNLDFDHQPTFYGINDNNVLVGDSIATPVPGTPQFNISPASLTFAPTPVGQSTAPQPVTIRNTGDARLDMFAFGDLVFTSNTIPRGFKADPGCFSGMNVVTSLAPGASCTMMVSAVPGAQGQQNGTEFLHYSAFGSPQTFTMSVTGTVPPPTCSIATTSDGVSLTMQDTNSGLSSIIVTGARNASVSIPSFPSGTTSPVTATASRMHPDLTAEVDLQATNVAGGSTDCGTTFGPAEQWTGLGGYFTGTIAVAANSDGRLQAFTRGTDNALWTISQTAPDGAWSPWTSIGGVLGSDPAVGVNSDGRLEVFALGSDNSLWTIAQSSPGAGFSGWQGLGNTLAGAPSVATNSDGRMQVFARGSDNALWTISQTSAGGSWNSWLSLGGALANDATPAIVNTNGSMEVFAIGTDNGVWHQWQLSPGGADWSGWSALGGSIATVRPVINTQSGLVGLAGLGTDNAYWTLSHLSGSDWGSWTSLGGFFNSAPSALFDGNGLLEIFGRGGDNSLYRNSATQADPPFNFAGWEPLGGYLANGPAAALNQDGRVAVFAEGGDGSLWTIEQAQPGTW
ncbi:MAG TPA: hypothetical protein VHZ74_19245 [Bryobacteraceae bacterium]|nr:hypothetical protein [Bryobacteraceae bacterium]